MSVQPAAVLRATMVADFTQFETGSKAVVRNAQGMADQVGRSGERIRQSIYGGARSFEELRAAVDPTYAAMQKYRALQQQLTGYVEAGEASQRAANIVMEQAARLYLGVETSAERAARAQREQAQAASASAQQAAQAQAEQARTVAMLTGNFQSLRASLDPLYAASKRYESAIETADAALKAKIITEGEHVRVLQLAQMQLQGITPAAGAAGAAAGKFGMVANQLGYQLQDVFVSAPLIGWFRAIGQQAPQAAGAFAMLGGSIGTIVPWIGTFIAVGMAVAPMLFNMETKAKSLQDRINDLSGSLQQYEDFAVKARGTSAELFSEFGIGATRGRELYEALAMVERIKFAQNLTASVQGLAVNLRGITELIAQWDYATLELPPALRAETIYLAQEAVRELEKQYGLTLGQARQVTNAMSQLSMAQGPEQAAIASKGLAQALLGAHAAGARLPPELLDAARAAAETGVSAERMNAILNNSLGIGTSMSSEFDRLAASIGYAAASAAGLAAQLGAAAVAGAQQADRQLQIINAQIAAVKSGQNEVVAGQLKGLELDKEAFRSAQLLAGVDAGIVETMVRKNFASQEAKIHADQELQSVIKIRSEAERAAKAAGAGDSKATKAAEKLSAALDKEAERWLDVLDPVAKYKREMGDLLQLQGRLSEGQMAAAMRQLNVQFADSLPLVGGLVDSLTDGLFNGFKGTLGSIGDMFKGWLAEMIATAAKNRIIMSLGLGGGSMIGSAAAAAAPGIASGGMGNLLGGAGMLSGLSGIGTTLSGIWSGLGGILSGGGLGASFANLGGMISGSVAGLGAFGAALPAIGLVGLAIGLFSKKVKLLDSGIRVTVDGMDALIESFRKTETSRLFGLVKSRDSSYKPADAVIADPLKLAVSDVQRSIIAASATLGINRDAFKNFAAQISVSTKGMTDEEALKAVQDGLVGLGDDFAGMIKGIDGLSHAGEGAMDTVLRLSGSLTAVQQVADTLGHSFRLVGLVGGDVASNLADAFGGLDAMAQATQAYFGTFYTEQERVATITRQTTAQLAKMGLAMPQSRDEYRRMIETLDLSKKSSAELYAALIGLSGVMDQILPTVGSLTQQLAALSGTVQTDLDRMMEAALEAQQASSQAASDWYRAAGSIRDYIDRLRGTAGALVNAQQALGYNTARYQQMLMAAMGGDLTATQGITTAAQTMLDSVRAVSRNRVEMARAEARVLSELGLVQGAGDIEGARHDVIAGLLGQQVDVLTQTRDFLASGGALSTAQIDALNAQLGGLESAIKAAEMINYQFLQQRLSVSVDLIATANVPADVRKLLANASTGVTGYVDFVTRSNLPADLKWLALTGASEHVKTVDYLAQNSMGVDLTRLALATTSTLQKTVSMAVGKQLPADVMRLALAGNSELSRVVTATLGTNIGADAMRLALGNVGAYSVSVMAALSPAVSPAVKRMVIEQQGSYAAVIEAAIGQTMTGTARRILLTQQGQYIANVVGVLASDMPAATRKLLIEANTAAVRAVTVTAAFASTMKADERAALISAAQSSYKTIRAAIDLSGMSASGALFLAQIGLGNMAVQKSLIGKIALGALSGDQRLLLTSVSGEVLRNVHLQATGRLTEDQWRLLTAVSASVLRRVDFTTAGGLTADQRAILGTVSGSAQRLLQMVTQGALTHDQRTILAATASSVAYGLRLTTAGTLTDDQRRVLLTTAGTLSRALALSASGKITDDQRNLLTVATGQFARGLALTTTGALTADQREIVTAEAGLVGRMLSLVVKGAMTEDQRAIVAARDATVYRALWANAYLDPKANADALSVMKSAGWAYKSLWATAMMDGKASKDALSILHANGWSYKTLWTSAMLDPKASRDALQIMGAYGWSYKNLWAGASLDGKANADALRILNAAGTSYKNLWAGAYLATGADKTALGILNASGTSYKSLWATAYTDWAKSNPDAIRILNAEGWAYKNLWAGASLDGRANSTALGILNANGWAYKTLWADAMLDGRSNRDAVGVLNASGWSYKSLSAQAYLASGANSDALRILTAGGWSYKNLWTEAYLSNAANADALKILRASSATITKKLIGEVNLDALTDRQKAMIDAITGKHDGKITLGGSFVFDPSAGFQTWYAQTTAGSITAPMTVLQLAMVQLGGSLDALQEALLAETTRATRADQLARLNSYAATLTTNGAGNAFVTDDDLSALAKIVGLNTTGLGINQLRSALTKWDVGDALKGTIYDPTGAKEAAYLDRIKPPVVPKPVRYSLDDYRFDERQSGSDAVTGYWITGPLGGKRLYNGGNLSAAQQWLTGQGFPAFARGGTHKGGPAYIGENDLELVAPSRVYSPSETRDMLDNRQVVAELRALRQELAATRAENTQLLLRIEGHERQVARTLRDWDTNGQPAERTS